MTIPFQAIECNLFGIEAVIPDGVDAQANLLRGAQCLDLLVRGKKARAEIAGYDEEGVPCVNIFVVDSAADDYVETECFVNQALVEEGVCRCIRGLQEEDSQLDPEWALWAGEVEAVPIDEDVKEHVKEHDSGDTAAEVYAKAEQVVDQLLSDVTG